MAKHKVGDKVRVRCPDSHHHNEETTVISPLRIAREWNSEKETAHYLVDIPMDEDMIPIGFEPHELIPIQDDDDKASWEEIEELTDWNPRRIEA